MVTLNSFHQLILYLEIDNFKYDADEHVQMNKKSSFIRMGLIGLTISFVLNLFNYYVLGVGGENWWSVWFPTYSVWFVFLIIGIGLIIKNKSNSGK